MYTRVGQKIFFLPNMLKKLLLGTYTTEMVKFLILDCGNHLQLLKELVALRRYFECNIAHCFPL